MTTVVVITAPTANFIPVPGTCNGITPLNNGYILLSAVTNGDRYAVSSGNTYTGGATYATATAIGTLPVTVQTGVSNAGATYTVRVYNGSDACFRDFVVIVPAANCPMDPMGYIYCEETGQIIRGGTISVIPPAGATYTITQNGFSGRYQFFTDGTPGTYTIVYTPPAGYALSTIRLPAGASYNPTAVPNPNVLGSESTNGLFLDDFTAATNPYYYSFTFDVNDSEIILNNIPLKGCCVAPPLTVNDGLVCSGGSIDLSTLANGTGGTMTYHATRADAVAGTPTIGSVVSPASATNYYVRNAVSATCYTIKEIVIRIKAPTCGAIQVTGPN
jgi:hypothetical protein